MKKIVNKLATLTVKRSADYGNTVVHTLREAGFTVIQEHDGMTEDIYIIGDKAESEPQERSEE